MSDNHVRPDAGFALIEAMAGVLILGILASSFIQVLPALITTQKELDFQQALLTELHKVRDQAVFQGHSPSTFHVLVQGRPVHLGGDGSSWCGSYERSDGHQRTICL